MLIPNYLDNPNILYLHTPVNHPNSSLLVCIVTPCLMPQLALLLIMHPSIFL